LKLFLSRHAESSFNAPSDRERPITGNGIEQTKRLIGNNFPALKEVEYIWCSDLRRAKETASLYREKIGRPDAIGSFEKQKQLLSEKTFLSPDGDIKKVFESLSSLSDDAVLLIVSHQPLIGELVSELCEGNVYQAHPFAPSEVVVVECDVAESGMGKKVANYLP